MAMQSARKIEWEQELSGLGLEVQCYEVVSSTMDTARGCNVEREFLVLTEKQSQGRGRRGRSWMSVEGGFFGTYALQWGKSATQLSGLSLVVGLVVAEMLESYGCKVGLKWPNDVLSLDGKKICGILIEMAPPRVLIGIGINLQGFPQDLGTSIQILGGEKVSVVAAAQALTPLLLSKFAEFSKNGFAHFKPAWLKRALYRGEKLDILIGSRKVHGTFEDISGTGALLIRDSQGKLLEISVADQIRPVLVPKTNF
jgi:BirA family transcriptional regulator, biotin operon repressor / biotin---[acetyl-CoA-carboxylase] ligase